MVLMISVGLPEMARPTILLASVAVSLAFKLPTTGYSASASFIAAA